MSILSASVDAPAVRSVGGKIVIYAHWPDAGELQMYLHRRGIPSVRYWDPTELEGRLEVTPYTDEEQVSEAVHNWLNGIAPHATGL